MSRYSHVLIIYKPQKEREKERKYHLTSMDYIVNMEVNSVDICTLF